MCDLRMGEGSNSRVIQHYRPTGLSSADNVSVSGLDLSRDKQELLVSYESDQIYTFPVFSQITSKAGPTVDQIRDLCNEAEDEHKVLTELAAYGGHLNRFTFLKVRDVLDFAFLLGYNIFCFVSLANLDLSRMPNMRVRETNTFAQDPILATPGFTKKLLGRLSHF